MKESRGDELSRKAIQAMSHPLRIQILSIAGERTASPVEMAEITGEPLAKVSYHVRVLLGFDFLEPAQAIPHGGTIENFYRVNSDSFGSR